MAIWLAEISQGSEKGWATGYSARYYGNSEEEALRKCFKGEGVKDKEELMEKVNHSWSYFSIKQVD